MSSKVEPEDNSTLRSFVREHTADAVVYTVGPVVIAIALVTNALVHGLSPVVPVAFGLALVIYAVLVTRHNIATAKIARLESAWGGVESSAD